MNTDRQHGAVLGRDVLGTLEHVAENAMGMISQAGRLAAIGGLKAAAGIRQLADDVALELGMPVFSDHHDPVRAFQDAHDHAGGSARALRIGLIDADRWPAAFRKAFEHSAVDLPVEFVALSEMDLFEAVGHADLDAAVTLESTPRRSPKGRAKNAASNASGGRTFRVATRVLAKREPGLDSWSFDASPKGGLAFPALFPLRVDCGSFTVQASGKGFSPADAAILRALTDAAALLSRHPARLDSEHRVSGRRPMTVDACKSWAQACIAELASALAAGSPSPKSGRKSAKAANSVELSEASATAARLLSAWLCSDDLLIEAQLRRAAAEVAARALSNDATVALRLAAIRIAVGDADAGLRSIQEGSNLLGTKPGPDASSFVVGELNCASNSPLALGRAAAGVCLTLSSQPPARRDFLRDDLQDDIRQCDSILAGGEEESLLIRVMDLVSPRRAKRKASAPSAISFKKASRAIAANSAKPRAATKRRKAA